MLTNDWQPIEGGIATLSAGMAHALARRGHHVTVLAPARHGATEGSDDAPRVRVERWRGYAWGWLRGIPFALHATRFVRSTDVVLAMNPGYGGVLAALSRRLGGSPYLAWAYGLELLKARRTPLQPLYTWVFRHAKAAIAISRWTRQRLLDLGVPETTVLVVPPGVAPPASEPGPPIRAVLNLPEGDIILSVGRLIPRKGHRALLTVFARVLKRHPSAHWVVVGRGPELGSLQRAAAELGIAHRVHLLGYVAPSPLARLYAEATVFALLPTESVGDAEGFGIVFLEAGSHGVAVVATRTGGIDDAVEDDVSGLLVAPADLGAATSAILSLLDQPELRERLGQAGRERATAHSWDAAASAVDAVLQR